MLRHQCIIYQACKKRSLLTNRRICADQTRKHYDPSSVFSLSLFFPQTNTRALYTRVEGITLLTGNPGYCNLPRLDSTCLSAVWYRVGHCCNWSRNAIALLIIEIINGTRYRAASQLQDRINRNILVNGAKEDFERLSFECYEHHDTRSSSSFVEF